jgi:hypothetical protein
MAVQGLDGEAGIKQVEQEGLEDLHDTLTREKVMLVELPALRPPVQVWAIRGKGLTSFNLNSYY